MPVEPADKLPQDEILARVVIQHGNAIETLAYAMVEQAAVLLQYAAGVIGPRAVELALADLSGNEPDPEPSAAAAQPTFTQAETDAAA